jgi:hypothetical protein
MSDRQLLTSHRSTGWYEVVSAALEYRNSNVTGEIMSDSREKHVDISPVHEST